MTAWTGRLRFRLLRPAEHCHGPAPAGCAWVTVMANMNTLAVAALTDTACVILAEGAVLDDAARKKALDQEITVLSTDMPVFEAALKIHGMLS